ncbi:MAG: hypothetical protein RSA66_09365 [Muribaculaceae bacterium]
MEKEKLMKYAKKYWWVILIVVCCIVGPLLPKEPIDYVKEANNIQDKIIESSDVEKLTANLDSASRLLDVMKKVNDVDSNFVNAKNNLDSTVTYRDAIYNDIARKIQLKQLFGRNGRCYPMSVAIENNMNDPDSYEFVESSFKVIDNDTFLVTERCRGKNAFNATIVSTWQGVVTISGEILSLKEL